MSGRGALPKRLIEVDLPIKRISAHARREKSIRHGHISTLHIWWARRPLAACRAVICASLWPDPADELCPSEFRVMAAKAMYDWAFQNRHLGSSESLPMWELIRQHTSAYALGQHPTTLRKALLDFIADFANWDNSTVKEYLTTARQLTAAAHYALSLPVTDVHTGLYWPDLEEWDTTIDNLQSKAADHPRPLVVDPFAGGGSIPLEALRVGADAFASDLNPVAVLLNKVVLEYIPKYGQRLADEVRKWGEWIKKEAEKELAQFYPKDSDGATPIAYLWARTITCEGPGCGAEIPLMNQRLISKRRNVGVEFIKKPKFIETNIRNDLPLKMYGNGTVINGKISCPNCGYTISSERYRDLAKNGKLSERHFCTVLSTTDGNRRYRNPSKRDSAALRSIRRKSEEIDSRSMAPRELLSTTEPRRLNVLHYGFKIWSSLFNERQLVAWTTFSNLLKKVITEIKKENSDIHLVEAISTLLGLVLSNMLQYNCNMSTWLSDGMISVFIQSSSIPMRADYAEANPLMNKLVGGLSYQLTQTEETIRKLSLLPLQIGTTTCGSATSQMIADDASSAIITDPPYYFAIPYAELSDFFYVWLKKFLQEIHPDLLNYSVTPKKDEAIQNLTHSQTIGQKDRHHFEEKIFESMTVGRREVTPFGIAIVVFAHASTEGWESLLISLLKAGWVVTASWPIDTEKESRMLASRQRSLASSIHLVCRPRENPDGSVREDDIGDWRDVLNELPIRIHEWMPRLAEEGIVGADAIFACLGPALEIFSRYSCVEKGSGEVVSLKDYLTEVWAAVAREALIMVFEGADASGFEEDARLTAMWLWTLNGNNTPSLPAPLPGGEGSDDEDDEESSGKKKVKGGYALEYDAARKIAQGLGANLDTLRNMVEVKGDTARLLPVNERASYLFGKDQKPAQVKARKKSAKQTDLFKEMTEGEITEETWGEMSVHQPGRTTLDRVHQSMILFAAGRSAALRRFLVEDGAGRDQKFWRLAQALSALYPAKSDEKRWVDGVMSKKKGWGL